MSMGGKGSSGTNTVTQQSAPPPQVMQAYQALLKRGNQVANTPLQQYGGGLLAGFNPTQTGAFGQTAQAAGAQTPYLNQAQQYAQQGAAPVFGQVQKYNGQNLQSYMSPYNQSVIDTTMANMNRNNAIQSNQLMGQGIASGNAFGGDRAGVAQAELGRNQALASDQTIAGLNNQNFTQAQGELNTQQNLQLQGLQGDAWRQANAASQMGGLGAEAQGLGLAGASANMQVGGLQQQLQQEQLNIPYEMYLQQQAYPFQTTQFLGGLTNGVAGGMGGSSSTTQPSPSALSQLGGLGMTGLGLAGATGGFGAGGWLSGLLGGGAAAGGLAGALGSAAGVTAGGGIADLLGSGLGLGLALKRGGRAGYDDGGAVQGGVDPGALSYERYMGMSLEDLQRQQIMYPPSTPQGQMISHALQAKRMQPSMQAPAPQPSQQGLAAANVPQFGRGGFAGGGLAGAPSGMFTPIYAPEPMGSSSEVSIPMPPIPIADNSGSQDPGGETYQSGSDAGPFDQGALPKAPGYGLPHPHILSKPSSPVPDTSVTPHGGGLGIPQAPEPDPAADSSSPSDQGLASAAPSVSSTGAGGGPDAGSEPAPADDSGIKDDMGGMLNSPWLGVAQAGLATMAGTSPFAAVNIGKGGLAGIQAAQQQQVLRADLGLKRAQAEGAQAQADISRLTAKAIQSMPNGSGVSNSDAGGGGGGSGGGGGGDAGGSGGGGSGEGGYVPLSAVAPEAARNLQLAAYYGRLPAFKGLADSYQKMAEMDPAFMHWQGLAKDGFVSDGRGNFFIPPDVLKGKQILGAANGIELKGNMYTRNSDGQIVPMSQESVGADGKKVLTVNTGAGQQGSGQGRDTANQTVMPWADPNAKTTAEVFGTKYAPVFQQSEKQNGLPPNILSGQAWVESHFNPNAISPAGAQGVMQLMPQTAGETNAWDPTAAIGKAGQLDAHLMQKYSGGQPPSARAVALTLAGYNWGEGNVDKWLSHGADINKMPAETRNYINNVLLHMTPAGSQVRQQQQAADAGGGGGSNSVVLEDPAATAKASEQGKGYAEQAATFRQEEQNGMDQNFVIDQMMAESKGFTPGKFAPYQGMLQGWMRALFPKDPQREDSYSDWTAFNKNAGVLLRSATKDVSSRAAAQEMFMIAKSLPTDEMSSDSLRKIGYQMKGASDWKIARAHAYLNGTIPGATDANFTDKYQNAVGPAAFMIAEMARGGDEAAPIFQQVRDRMNSTAEGKKAWMHLAQQVKFIEDNGLLPDQTVQ